jgi:protocatechuate 3,4-dioxygenase beta subunit
MILGRLRLIFVARNGAPCLGIAALACPAFAQVFPTEVGRPASGGRPEAALVIAGRVRDAGGTAIRGVRVVVVTSEPARSARPLGLCLANRLPYANEFHGPRDTDEQGRFEIVVPEGGSGSYTATTVYAAAPGHGAAIRALRSSPGRQEIELSLGAEYVVRGRIVDLKGQPVVGVSVRLVEDWWLPPPMLGFWAPTTTDDKGLFLIRGLGPGKVGMQIEGETITPQRSEVEPMRAGSDAKWTLSVAPAKRLHGRVVFADTGRPVAGASIVSLGSPIVDRRWLETRTDADGRFEVHPFVPDERQMAGRAKTYFLNVFPPPGAPYTVAEVAVGASGASAQEVKVELRRGMMVRGRVTEAGSGEPVAGARVQYVGRGGEHMVGVIEPSRLDTALSGPDGRYALAVPPEPGTLFVLGPTPDYISAETSDGELNGGLADGKRHYADAFIPLAPRPEDGDRALDIRLRRGVTLRGRLLGPGDTPVDSFLLFSPSYRVHGYRLYEVPPLLLSGTEGRFELRGCDPGRPHAAYLLDPDRRLGAKVVLTGQNADEPATIRLQSCGAARARFVTAAGKARAKYRPMFYYLLTEGAPLRGFYAGGHDRALEADQGPLVWQDGNSWRGGWDETDGDGRITFPALVPGAAYRLQWLPRDITDPKPWPHLDFTVSPGEVKDLGDLVVNEEGL